MHHWFKRGWMPMLTGSYALTLPRPRVNQPTNELDIFDSYELEILFTLYASGSQTCCAADTFCCQTFVRSPWRPGQY